MHVMPLVIVLAVATGGGQNTAPPTGKIDFRKASEEAQTKPPEVGSDIVSLELKRADLEQQARHIQWQRDYERRGWEWHLCSTKMLFLVVVVIVLFGLFITWLQFRRDYSDWERRPAEVKPSTPAAASPSASPENPPPGATTFKLTPAGLEVTSQIVGLVVLALSLAFFFLYVKEVYPIREVEVLKPANAPVLESAPADRNAK